MWYHYKTLSSPSLKRLRICAKCCVFHLRSIYKIRRKLIRAFISSRLDYRNGIFYEAHGKDCSTFRTVQPGSWRVSGNSIISHPSSTHLHQYKILLVAHKCITWKAPPHSQELISRPLAPLDPPAFYAMFLQRELSLLLRRGFGTVFTKSVNSFKAKLKTHLFKKAF